MNVKVVVAFLFLSYLPMIAAQMGTPTPLSSAERQKAEAEKAATSPVPNYPKLVDITKETGISFDHKSVSVRSSPLA